MKRCAQCAREIPESATACVHCVSPAPAASTHVSTQAAANPLDGGSQAATAVPAQAAVTPKPAARRVNPRMILGVGLLVGGVGTLALVIASSSPAVPVVVPTAAPTAGLRPGPDPFGPCVAWGTSSAITPSEGKGHGPREQVRGLEWRGVWWLSLPAQSCWIGYIGRPFRAAAAAATNRPNRASRLTGNYAPDAARPARRPPHVSHASARTTPVMLPPSG